MGRMHKALRQGTVIGQQQQAFGMVIETTNRINTALNAFEVIHNRAAALRIRYRRDDALRLIEQIIFHAFRFQAFPVDFDAVHVRINLHAQLRHRAAIDLHLTGYDELLCLTARRKTTTANILLQTL